MAKDERLENPMTYYPDIPGYMVPLLQSQARQEIKTENIERSTRALWARQRELPCENHGRTLARMDERMKAIEGVKKTNALADAVRSHPRITGGSILTTVIGVGLFVLEKAGLL